MILAGLPRYFFGFTGLYNPEYAININIPHVLFIVAKSISQFISSIRGGMAMSTSYEVSFQFTKAALKTKLQKAISDTSSGSLDGNLITMLCNEAQLPNVSSMTGQTQGVFLGEAQVNYSYSKLFTDVSLGWLCDYDMKPLKFLQEWHDSQFTYDMVLSGDANDPNVFSRQISNRINYPDDYEGTIIITKIDKDDRKSMKYTLLNAFPYSIDATPLSYGSSQVVTVSANFYYSKYFVQYSND